MIEFLPETKGNLVAIKMSGTITEEDHERFLPEADPIFDRERIEHLVLDLGVPERMGSWRPLRRHLVRDALPCLGRARRHHRRGKVGRRGIARHRYLQSGRRAPIFAG